MVMVLRFFGVVISVDAASRRVYEKYFYQVFFVGCHFRSKHHESGAPHRFYQTALIDPKVIILKHLYIRNSLNLNIDVSTGSS